VSFTAFLYWNVIAAGVFVFAWGSQDARELFPLVRHTWSEDRRTISENRGRLFNRVS
jgi:hypothetical protein